MYYFIHNRIKTLFYKKAPVTGIGLFRLFFGLITFQEILFLIYFNHLIFDPIPFLDIEFPMIGFFLWIWAIVAFALAIGYKSQTSCIANYIFWLIFVNFTPMQRDFDGGFDLFMIGANFFLIFMPIDKAFALDELRKKLASPFVHYSNYVKPEVSALVYYLPVMVCLGFLYFDSSIHKMFAVHWRNGLGAWLPSSMPYYISAIDMSSLLNIEILQKIIGYTIIIFQFTFLFFVQNKKLKPIYFFIGIGLHLGITLSLNIYPFGLGMLIFYTLIVPFHWYYKLGDFLITKKPSLSVFYDYQCPLCCRTILIINHFDIFKRIDFKPAQVYAKNYAALQNLDENLLLKDLYAIDNKNKLYQGVSTYAQILISLGYTALFGYFLKLPIVHFFASRYYRKIADSRLRISCDQACMPTINKISENTIYDKIFNTQSDRQSKSNIQKISKIFCVLIFLQINCSFHYGLLYRLHIDIHQTTLSNMSNALLMFSNTFLGITPHALYLHDHFAGYNHLLAITYSDQDGHEHWLPFVNEQGRLLAPNWGRVHSMWANIAVTPDIDENRLKKFIMKVTAFWGIKQGLDIQNIQFNIVMKKISVPFQWEKDLRNKNLSGEWLTIGTARWQGKQIMISLPKDIDDL